MAAKKKDVEVDTEEAEVVTEPVRPNLKVGEIQYNSKGQLTALGAQQVIARGGTVLHKGQHVTHPDQITSINRLEKAKVAEDEADEHEPTFGDDNLPLSHFEGMSDKKILKTGVSKKEARKIRTLLNEREEAAAEAEDETETDPEAAGDEGTEPGEEEA